MQLFKESEEPLEVPLNLMDIGGSDLNRQCYMYIEQKPFNVLQNEYGNFTLRDKVYESNVAKLLVAYP